MRDPLFMSDGEVDPISHEPRPAPRIPRNVYGLPPPKYDLGVEIAAWLFVGSLIGLLWYLA